VSDDLVALIEGQEAARLRQGRDGQLTLVYAESWRQGSNAYPLSLSLPLALSEHGHDAVHAFLWGLLPDNERILDTWARRFGVSARNPFSLLANVGEDCAGAVQFVRPERVDVIREGNLDKIEWLTTADVAERLRVLHTDQAAWRRPGDEGQFSLAGARPKTALMLDDGRWGLPSGRTPTTHILKPPMGEYEGFVENEHFCLELAVALGLPAARSRVVRIEDQLAIVVERYDRIRTDNGWVRVHQEDLCQALGVPPTRKYENEGGPGVDSVVRLLRDNSSAPGEDVLTFVSALALNWLIAGTDAHAKNYSILIGARGRLRLAPLYDVASALPYSTSVDPHKIKLAMRIGGEYLLKKISRRQWEKLADQNQMDRDNLLVNVMQIAERAPDLGNEVRRSAERDGVSHPILARLTDAVASRAKACLELLRAPATAEY
jgi:serine/threonine-protein kinase HipA